MGSMIFGLILISLGIVGVFSSVQSHSDNFGIFIAIGAVMEIGGFLFFLSGVKQYFVEEIIIELKKMNGEVITKSTDQ